MEHETATQDEVTVSFEVEGEGLVVSLPEEALADGSAEARTVLVHVRFQPQGLGIIRGAGIDTSRGVNAGFFRNASPLMMSAIPAPNFKFSHWTANGNFASAKTPHRFFARGGLTIGAVFTG